MIQIPGIIFLAISFFFGAPIFCILAAIALLGWYLQGTSISAVGTDIFRLSSNFVLITIPMFTYAGYLLGESRAPQRLLKISHALFGVIPGGLAIITILASSLFTTLTGASGITIAALGSLLLPALLKDDYGEDFSLGLITTGGSLGLLFAPSVPLIIYGVVTKVSVSDMFIAGILPGLLMLLLLCIFSVLVARKENVQSLPFKWRAVRDALWEAKWEIPLPFIILGGIYGGFLTVNEAATVTSFWVFMVEVIINREITYEQHKRIVRNSMVMSGGILIIMAAALSSTNYFIDIDLPQKLFDFVQGVVSSRIVFLIMLNCFLFALGMILDIFSALIVMVPLILPVAQEYGINNIHLGIIFLANMQIGYLTPPLGMGLFISSFRFKRDIMKITFACLPFILILIFSVILITYWSDLSLFLLRIMGRPY